MNFPLRKSMCPLTTEAPLVSVIMFCRNRVRCIHRAVESLLHQSYSNWELVIQDGHSSDGTREVIERYTGDSRIKLVSEKDDGPFDAMWRCYRRAQGEIFGSCLSDEELLPHALEQGVRYLGFNPQAAALIRDVQYTDLEGRPLCRVNGDEFNFMDYMAMQFSLALCSMLIRREAMLDLDYQRRPWRLNCADFELLVRLGENHQIDYFPGIVAKYAQLHEDQLSTQPESSLKGAMGQLQFINDFFLEGPPLKPFRHLRSFPLIVTFKKLQKLYEKKQQFELNTQLQAFITKFDLSFGAPPLQLAQEAVGIGALDLARDILKDVPESSEDHASAILLQSKIQTCLGQPPPADSPLMTDSWPALQASPGSARRLDDRLTLGSWAPCELLHPEVLEAWVRILLLVPNARLLLANAGMHSSDVRRHFRKHFQEKGLPRENLHLLPRPESLVTSPLLVQTDLYLDTFPESDASGVAAALDNRIPTIARRLETSAGRRTAHHLENLHQEKWLTGDTKSYIVTVVKLVSKPGALQAVRTGLDAAADGKCTSHVAG